RRRPVPGPRPARRRGPAADAGRRRRLPRLVLRRGARRREALLLHAPALGRQGLGRRRPDVGAGTRPLRRALRRSPGARPCPLLLSEVLEGFVLDGAATALSAAAVIGLLNALVWPLLARLALPLTVMTLGLAALVLNGVLVGFALDLLPGAEVATVWEGIVITVFVAGLTAAIYSLLAIDEDEAWHRNVVRRQARRRKQVVESDVPGVLFLEIDGLAHDVLF